MMKKLMLATLLGTALISSVSYANIRVVLPHTANGTDACDTLPGNWSGTGQLTAFDGTQCMYTGVGNISKEASAGQFHIDMNLQAQSGQKSICISPGNTPLEATCSAGVINITTSGITLNGQATASSVDFNNGDIYGLYQVVDIDLNRS